MGRIPAAEIEQLKAQIDLVALVRAHGVELKKHGTRNFIGHCPFHDDRTPSLVVTPAKNLWHCMGACSMGGSVVDWVMKVRGVSFRHAIELLRSGTAQALLPAKDGKIPSESRVRKLESPVDPYEDDKAAMKHVVDFYNETLLEAPEALSYLAARGIESREALETFKLGFANRTLGLRLPMKQVIAGKRIRSHLQKLGVLRDTGHEHFNGSVTFPIFALDGSVTEIYGRKITRNLREGTPDHTYLPGPHRGVWNEAGVRDEVKKNGGVLILCEAIIDALSFWVNGFKAVTASYGTNGFTDDHLKLILDAGVRCVLIAYDRDEAGDAAAEKLAEKLQGEGVECRRVQFPKGMDANEYACKMKPARAALKVPLDGAVPYPATSLKARAARPSLPPAPVAAAPEPKAAVLFPPEPAPLPEPKTPPSFLAAGPSLDVPPPPAVTPLPGVELRAEDFEPVMPKRPITPAAPVDVPTEIDGDDVYLRLGEREYRVRGLSRNPSRETMKINLRASVELKSHVDTLDLYHAKARVAFIAAASEELGLGQDVLKRDLGRVLWKLEELQSQKLKDAGVAGANPIDEISEEEREEAMRFLQEPELLHAILQDFEACGVIGEEINKIVGYLAVTSRKLETPLAVVIQSTSAAGKSSLMETVLSMVPPEDRVQYSAMTGQSLFYMGARDLKNKCLAIAEEQGATQAAYALKLLQSEGEISIASTGKDPHTGKLVTQEYRVEGPVQLFLTTTAPEMDEELLNRCLVLTVDENRDQTRAIHTRQRFSQTLEGLLARKERQKVLRRHRNAQRLLRPLWVVNPLATSLEFTDTHTRTRRDHMKYLTLIRSIALLHQYSREVKALDHDGERIEYIEVTPKDVELADALFSQLLGRSLDELPPQARRLLSVLTERVTAESEKEGKRPDEYRFTRRQVREWLGWSDFQVQAHLTKLVQHEHVLVHRGSRGSLFVYELVASEKAAHEPVASATTKVFNLLRDASSIENAASRGGLDPFLGSVQKPKSAEMTHASEKVLGVLSEEPSGDKKRRQHG